LNTLDDEIELVNPSIGIQTDCISDSAFSNIPEEILFRSSAQSYTEDEVFLMNPSASTQTNLTFPPLPADTNNLHKIVATNSLPTENSPPGNFKPFDNSPPKVTFQRLKLPESTTEFTISTINETEIIIRVPFVMSEVPEKANGIKTSVVRKSVNSRKNTSISKRKKSCTSSKTDGPTMKQTNKVLSSSKKYVEFPTDRSVVEQPDLEETFISSNVPSCFSPNGDTLQQSIKPAANVCVNPSGYTVIRNSHCDYFKDLLPTNPSLSRKRTMQDSPTLNAKRINLSRVKFLTPKISNTLTNKRSSDPSMSNILLTVNDHCRNISSEKLITAKSLTSPTKLGGPSAIVNIDQHALTVLCSSDCEEEPLSVTSCVIDPNRQEEDKASGKPTRKKRQNRSFNAIEMRNRSLIMNNNDLMRKLKLKKHRNFLRERRKKNMTFESVKGKHCNVFYGLEILVVGRMFIEKIHTSF